MPPAQSCTVCPPVAALNRYIKAEVKSLACADCFLPGLMEIWPHNLGHMAPHYDACARPARPHSGPDVQLLHAQTC